MQKKHIKSAVLLGAACLCMMLASSWYSVTFNDSRLVVPMDFESYIFRPQDLPMIISIGLFCIYVITLFAALFSWGAKNNRRAAQTNTTRKINPKLGLLGFLGFLGFAGFFSYPVDGEVFPFIFFIFFGFFGFYYEGKMSGTYMDERFRENASRAQLAATRTTFSIIFVALILLCQGKLFGSLEYTLIAVIITLSLALALGLFLSEYLLYRYDHEEGEE